LPIGSAYKYLGVLETGGFKCEEVKSRFQEMYDAVNFEISVECMVGIKFKP